MDLSPLRPAEWLETDLGWWDRMVEARNLWDETHQQVRKAAEATAKIQREGVPARRQARRR